MINITIKYFNHLISGYILLLSMLTYIIISNTFYPTLGSVLWLHVQPSNEKWFENSFGKQVKVSIGKLWKQPNQQTFA